MKERPILFSAPMVRALLDGRKTQTRRMVRPQPDWLPEVHSTRHTGPFFWPIGSLGQQCGAPIARPYCEAGDVLWVRETTIKTPAGVTYVADRVDHFGAGGRLRKTPAIFMPRWASRITLQVTDVRVERLQAITDADAQAEGLYRNDADSWQPYEGADPLDFWEHPRQAYMALWNSINGPDADFANPWVWAITFQRT